MRVARGSSPAFTNVVFTSRTTGQQDTQIGRFPFAKMATDLSCTSADDPCFNHSFRVHFAFIRMMTIRKDPQTLLSSVCPGLGLFFRQLNLITGSRRPRKEASGSDAEHYVHHRPGEFIFTKQLDKPHDRAPLRSGVSTLSVSRLADIVAHSDITKLNLCWIKLQPDMPGLW